MSEKQQFEMLQNVNPFATNLNEITLGGTALHLTFKELEESDSNYFEFKLLYQRPSNRVRQADEFLPPKTVVDEFIISVKSEGATNYLTQHLEDGDAIIIRGWLDNNSSSETVISLDKKTDILYHKHFLDDDDDEEA